MEGFEELYDWEEPDGFDEEGPDFDCGRWHDGRLGLSCSRAGSEDCEFECPYRNGLYGGGND